MSSQTNQLELLVSSKTSLYSTIMHILHYRGKCFQLPLRFVHTKGEEKTKYKY